MYWYFDKVCPWLLVSKIQFVSNTTIEIIASFILPTDLTFADKFNAIMSDGNHC